MSVIQLLKELPKFSHNEIFNSVTNFKIEQFFKNTLFWQSSSVQLLGRSLKIGNICQYCHFNNLKFFKK